MVSTGCQVSRHFEYVLTSTMYMKNYFVVYFNRLLLTYDACKV